jgi:prepilin-type N-terminal cleavage/methylation domain-containing protein
MKGMQKNGFSLVELMISILLLLIISGAAVTSLIEAQRVTQGVAMEAATQENLRAGMHFMVRDIMQAGEGIPPGGISIPNSSAAVSALNWPGTSPAAKFPTSYVVLNGIVPGSLVGQVQKGVTNTGALITTGAKNSDMITVLYADNSLVESAGLTLYGSPVVSAGCTGGALTAASVTLATSCFHMPGTGPTPITTGNLIMFQNQNGTALEYVTSVSGQTMSFATGDPAGLNAPSATTYPNGTVAALLANGSVPTIVTRVWMVTYYLDSTTNPYHPQLVRQVNYPGYPTVATQVNAPQPIADDIEALNLTYDIIDSTAPSGTYPNGAGDAPQPASWTSPSAGSDSPSQIRAVNIYIAGRSETAYQMGKNQSYFHNNLSTQVCIRSLNFINNYNISSTTPE